MPLDPIAPLSGEPSRIRFRYRDRPIANAIELKRSSFGRDHHLSNHNLTSAMVALKPKMGHISVSFLDSPSESLKR